MTDRLDTIRKRLASGNPFTPHAGDLAWAVGEIERLTESCNAIPRILMEREAPKWEEARERLFTCLAALERATAQRDEYLAALWLCAYETAWVRTPGEYNLVQPWPMEEGPPRLLVMCSDTFAWACADCEPCEYPRASEVFRVMQTEGWPGVVRWVQAQRQERGEMAEPIEPVAKAMAREDELRAEIERLTAENSSLRSAAALNSNEYAFAAHEIDRLKGENARLAKKATESHAALRTVAHAIGVCHCWDFGCEPGPTADIVAAIEDLKRCEIREMDRDAAEIERLEKLAHPVFVLDTHVPMVRSKIARLDALSRATADDVEDAVPCLPCGKVECSCGDARDEMENA